MMVLNSSYYEEKVECEIGGGGIESYHILVLKTRFRGRNGYAFGYF